MGGIVIPHAPTAAEVRQRIIAIADAAPTTVIASVVLDETCPIAADQLPALVGVAVLGGSTRNDAGGNSNKREVTSTFVLRVLFSEICSSKKEDQLAALDVAWSRLWELPDWFAKKPRLELNDPGLRGVNATGHMSEDGEPFVTKWLASDYTSVLYSFTVTTQRA